MVKLNVLQVKSIYYKLDLTKTESFVLCLFTYEKMNTLIRTKNKRQNKSNDPNKQECCKKVVSSFE